ncbi:MAG: arginine repressor [Clostridiales bacterium]|nr:arginine repressor [Clostridiales bacterium]
MKSSRHDAILEIISSEAVDTQEMLTEKLRARGFSVTQATVSRDIKQLRLIKRATESGSYRYCIQSAADAQTNAKYKNILRETVVSISPAGSIVVIKTYTGMANAAAAAIDAVASELAIGTIAGDDTIFVATESEDAVKSFITAIKGFSSIA